MTPSERVILREWMRACDRDSERRAVGEPTFTRQTQQEVAERCGITVSRLDNLVHRSTHAQRMEVAHAL